MATISLGTVSGQSYPAMSIANVRSVKSPYMQKIENQLKAEGTKAIGEKAFDEKLRQLSKLLHHKNILVSSSVDSRSGFQNVVISDGETGKRIAELPPQAVIAITERARERHIGWIIDVMK